MMDESWRIPMGSMVPRRRSTEQTTRRRTSPPGSLDADDFRDVFGGPPRTVLLRQFSGGDLTTATSSSNSNSFDYHHSHVSRRRPSFYEEVFSPGGAPARGGTGGRNLPDFSIPAAARRRGGVVRTVDGFYNDIFGSNGGGGERRSRTRSTTTSKSKSSKASSPVMSWEEEMMVTPFRSSMMVDDSALSNFASKLRPITIPSRRESPSPATLHSRGEQSTHRTSSSTTTAMNPILRPNFMDLQFPSSNDPFRYSPAETTIVSLEPNSYLSFKKPMEDAGDVSDDDSVISSIYDIPMATIRPCGLHEKAMLELEKEVVVVLEEEEEAESSYVIELGLPLGRKKGDVAGAGEVAVDEAIAWARENFQTKRSPEEQKQCSVGAEKKHELVVSSRDEETPEREETKGMQDTDDYCFEQLRNGHEDAPTPRGKDFEPILWTDEELNACTAEEILRFT